MKLLSIVIFLVIFIMALVFSVLNFHFVEVHLFFFSFSLPLTLALTAELLAGMAIGYSVAVFQVFRLKKQYSEQRKKQK